MHNALENQEGCTQFMKNARLIGILMLIQLGFGILLNFFFLKPILNLDAQSVTATLPYLVGFSTLLALLLSSLNIAFGLLLPKEITQHFNNTFILIIIFFLVLFSIILCFHQFFLNNLALLKYLSVFVWQIH